MVILDFFDYYYYRGHNEMVYFLIHIGAVSSINHIDKKGNTALHFAAAHCDPEYVDMLLVCGAKITDRNHANRLPIEEAKVYTF